MPDENPLPPKPDDPDAVVAIPEPGLIVFDFRTRVLPLGKTVTALRHASIRRALELYESQEEAAAALGIPMTLFPAAVKEMKGIPERPERSTKPPPDPLAMSMGAREHRAAPLNFTEQAELLKTLAPLREAAELLNQLSTVAKHLSAVLDKATLAAGRVPSRTSRTHETSGNC